MSSQYSFSTESKRSSYGSLGYSVSRSYTVPCAGMKKVEPRRHSESVPERYSVSQRTTYQPSLRGRLCPSLTSTGVCEEIDDCPYSHTVEETRVFNRHFKTKICEFAANGFCTKANLCRYAHSFAELEHGRLDESAKGDIHHQFPLVGRNVSSVSTNESFGMDCHSPQPHNVSCGSDGELSPIVSDDFNSPRTRICYEAPTNQQAVFHHRQNTRSKSITIPSAYHYVEQLERMRAVPIPFAYVSAPYGAMYADPSMVTYGHPSAYYSNPMMYSMMSNDVIYED